MRTSSSRLPEFALVLITMVWGGTFLLVQLAMQYSGALFFVGCRFAAAALAVGLLSWRILPGMTRRDLLAGMAIGAMIALGYGLQTMGLRHIPSSESGLLTGLYVPLVPLLQWLFWRRRPHAMCLAGALCAFAGLSCFAGGGFSLSFSYGQVLTLLGAFAIALEIVLISHFAPRVDLRRVTVAQLGFAALFAFLLMPVAGELDIPPFSWPLLGLAAGLGMASAAIQATMNWAQKTVEPSRAAIIYAGEPIWAAVFGRMAGERLPALALLGGALIVLGIIVSELRPRWLRARRAAGQ
ncbi:DMT family transporter [Bordetella hinzii]|jgi:drug/metabolite transporter (DMT)-like permease|uniref:EamA/RhaT family transporter n=2 Tax=Bordetella hinzii TaxID=103855 RepID=A0AAN1VEB8_9BORD|nr:DMT family transporter [Bordetella hinzii]AKQ54861.1 putative DMT superfamily transporter inner membrane protein [Bordetella hinzii]AKQ59374.1 putative DMT superfamily transporter inner membrane protein [Bordetella hinzii]AZW15387.1 EamA/RhaT family transporter [Bordetella hinzii]KXA72040.1 transporter [Bordetella hinzii LMG 13501]MBZ0073927.1 DMT family transporter [Bordetella hinzii]